MKYLLENFVLKENLFPTPLKSEKKRFLIEKTKDWELILMIWGAESESPIHDHGESTCWTRLLKGSLSEKTFLKDSLLQLAEHNFNLDEINYVEADEGVHQIINSSQDIAFTVHLYMKPLAYCNVFDDISKDWKVMENQYDSYEGI